nr:xylulose kinase-1 [Tanacetum cinerariifolium]
MSPTTHTFLRFNDSNILTGTHTNYNNEDDVATVGMKIPLLEYFATVSAKEFPLLSSSVAPAEEFALLDKDKDYSQSKTTPQEETDKGPASESSAKKKGSTVVITTKDMQKMRNDVKARTTLLLALFDEHQLRFSKYETPKELWEAILKTFGGNEATKKTKKNQLKQQ